MLILFPGTSLGLDAKDQDMIDREYSKTIDEYAKIICSRGYNVGLHPSLIYNWTTLRSKELKVVEDIKNIINPVSVYSI